VLLDSSFNFLRAFLRFCEWHYHRFWFETKEPLVLFAVFHSDRGIGYDDFCCSECDFVVWLLCGD
jgi:hypothetical protein